MQHENISSLVSKISIINQIIEKDSLIETLKQIDNPTVISFINAHAINTCYQNTIFFEKLKQSDYLLRDGVGLEILFKKAGLSPGLNMNGTDFIPEILNSQKSEDIALYGTSVRNVETTAEILERNSYKIISRLNGFMDQDTYIDDAKAKKPKIILLGMGMPKQEEIAIALKNQLDYPCLIINGGALIDFMSNRIKRAPKIIRRFKCEWLFRLAQEPGRLYKRYLIGNFLFLIRTRILAKKIRNKASASVKTF